VGIAPSKPNTQPGESKDPIDEISLPRLNPWLALLLLLLPILAYILIWIKLLGG
jgi:hypothetical protein